MEVVNLLTKPSKLMFAERWFGGVPAGRFRCPQFLPRNPSAVSAVDDHSRSNPQGYSFPSYVTGRFGRVLRRDCSKVRQSHKYKFGAFQTAFAIAAAAGIDMATCQTTETADSRTVVHEPQSNGETLPELMTEFMVDMKCEGCVTAVRNSLESLDGVKRVDVDLPNQVVRVLGSASIKTLTDAFEQSSRKARLIGQGSPEDFLVSAAVAEFKGPKIFGVVRFAQVNMELARVEANFSGLSPGCHGWSINEFGDLTKGAASTGQIFSLPNVNDSLNKPLGNLGILNVGDNGEALFSELKYKLKVADLIGRAVVLYDTEDMSCVGIAAAVIARSAGVGQNYKKICTCDGTVIWEASNSDFVKV